MHVSKQYSYTNEVVSMTWGAMATKMHMPDSKYAGKPFTLNLQEEWLSEYSTRNYEKFINPLLLDTPRF